LCHIVLPLLLKCVKNLENQTIQSLQK